MAQVTSAASVDRGRLRAHPEALVAVAGLILILYAWGLFWFTAAGLLVIGFFVALLATFTVLGVFVARDAPRWGTSGVAWGFLALFTGPMGVVLYVWAKWGGTKARARMDPK